MLDLESFNEDLSGKDDLGMVVRAHLHVESMLDNLIDCLVPAPQHINKLRLDYAPTASPQCYKKR